MPNRPCLHNDPHNWLETIVAGVVRTTCKRCGGFIGQRPVPADSKPKRQKGGRRGTA